ncbi:MAG: MATE family efflux transporter [Myxococcota bacterium]|nr:MATE family efflux transporter [Myxococcota bacterium]
MRGAGGKLEVAILAWPLAVGLLSFTLMGVTDTILMGHVGTEAQAGVGLGATMIFFLVAFFRGLTSGAQSLISAADGAGQRKRILQAAGGGLLIGLLCGLVAMALTMGFITWFMPSLSESAAVIDNASGYMLVRAWVLPISLISFALMSILQGLGDTKIRMWASICGNAVNIILDFIFIFGWGPIPAMGAEGAALATAAGSVTMCAFYAWRFYGVVGRARRPSLEVLRSCIAIGLPAGAQAGLGALAFATMTAVLARVGPAHLAASQIALNIISVSFLPGYGLGEAAGVLAGRYLGAGKPRTAARTIRSAREMALYIMGLCGLLFLFVGSPIVGFFTQDADVQRIAETCLLSAAVFQLLDAIVLVNLCALRSLGDTRFTFAATSFAAWVIMLPLTYVLALSWSLGAVGAWFAMIMEFAVLAVLTTWRVSGVRHGTVGRVDLLLGSSVPRHYEQSPPTARRPTNRSA